MTLKEYFELEDELREYEKRYEHALGTMADWDKVHHDEDFKARVRNTLEVTRYKVNDLKEKVLRARLELSLP